MRERARTRARESAMPARRPLYVSSPQVKHDSGQVKLVKQVKRVKLVKLVKRVKLGK